MLRMLFPFALGMLLARHFKPLYVRGAFAWCSLALVGLFAVPYIEGQEPVCMNSVYELFCLVVAFPLIVWLGASGVAGGKKASAVCDLLGQLSYPLYVIHYPFMYLFYDFLIKEERYTLASAWPQALAVVVGCLLLAYALLKCYDLPVRRYLARRV